MPLLLMLLLLSACRSGSQGPDTAGAPAPVCPRASCEVGRLNCTADLSGIERCEDDGVGDGCGHLMLVDECSSGEICAALTGTSGLGDAICQPI